MKFPRNARIFRGQLDASPFVGVLFLVAMFLLLNSSLVFLPGVAIRLPEASDLPGVTDPPLTVAVDTNGRFYFRSQIIKEGELRLQLRKAVRETREPLALVLMADKSVSYEILMRLYVLASETGIKQILLPVRTPSASARTSAER